ncbi:hypothetical protein H0H92_015328 [Tricholoma furcatifolium]|nr:hypothetical protein H0H92_015328 [Tricholoma furcatifolium]
MSATHYPITHLFPGKSHTTVISGPIIQVIDTTTGDIRCTVTDPAGPIRCAAVDRTHGYLATAGDDKMLKLWKVDGLERVNERELPKRPTSILFTQDAKTILVSDKFGDVFSYTFEFTPLSEKEKKDALSSHENPSGGALVLGHASLLSAFLLSQDERYIISADRDEHIRVSWYPQGYTIEMYCLGHTKFVSAIHNPPFAPADLVSGGGDPALKVWDWMSGTAKYEIPVWDAVEPFIRVRSPKRKRGEEGGEAGEAKRKGRGKKAKGRGKGKGKEKAKAEDEAGEEEEKDEAEEVEAEAEAAAEVQDEVVAPDTPVGAGNVAEEDKGDKILVIRKIETTPSRHVLFSAVGATALFSVDYPSSGSIPAVRSFELGQPVLDFIVLPDENMVWVTLDGNWSDGTMDSTSRKFLRVLKISESGELSDNALGTPIINALGSTSRLAATAEDLKKLELYNDLVAMPKGHDAENEQDGDAEPEKQSKKTAGRLKNKQKVLEKEQSLALAGVEAAADDSEEPSAKKPRSEGGDVDMADA